MASIGNGNQNNELTGTDLGSLRAAFSSIQMPVERRAVAHQIVIEVLNANEVETFNWYKTPGTPELKCKWDLTAPNSLFVTASEVHVLADDNAVRRPERPTDWSKLDGKYVGWNLDTATGPTSAKAGSEPTKIESSGPRSDTQDSLRQLATAKRSPLRELSEQHAPRATGIYCLWLNDDLLYVGISTTAPEKTTNPQAAGLAGRLLTHRRSRLTSDFALGVAMRYVIPTLSKESQDRLTRGVLGAPELEDETREWIRNHVAFSCLAADPGFARAIERHAFQTGLPGVGRPLLNRLSAEAYEVEMSTSAWVERSARGVKAVRRGTQQRLSGLLSRRSKRGKESRQPNVDGTDSVAAKRPDGETRTYFAQRRDSPTTEICPSCQSAIRIDSRCNCS